MHKKSRRKRTKKQQVVSPEKKVDGYSGKGEAYEETTGSAWYGSDDGSVISVRKLCVGISDGDVAGGCDDSGGGTGSQRRF